MMQTLPKRQQRHLAAGILGASVLLLLAIIVLPVWKAHAAYTARIDQLQSRLVRLQSHVAANEALRPQYEQLIRSQTTSGHQLKSDTAAVAAAELQRIVKGIANKNATHILSTQIIPAAEEQGFIRVALRVHLRGPLEGIVQSLYDIEASATFLFLDKMSIRGSARRRILSDRPVNQFDNEFELIAYMPKPL